MKEIIKLGMLSLLLSCTPKKIEITSEYIINENWNRTGEIKRGNSITLEKMKVKRDSVINYIPLSDELKVLNKLEVDSTFIRYANIKIEKGESYKRKKIYFNRFNGFYWNSLNAFNIMDSSKTIGNLQPGNWYKFSDLEFSRQNYIVIYIDSLNNAHRFNVNMSNF